MISHHTPGPWNFIYLSGGMVGVAAKGRGLIINVTASKEAIKGGMTAEEEEVNARLIAKAPEMYALIHRIAQEWPNVAEAMAARTLIREIEGQP